jgi:hypothetical protein
VRCAVALAVLLLAGPAAGGDLVRYRAADGTVGLVDHPSKLPPGAIVLETSKPTERAPDPEPAPEPVFQRSAPAQRRSFADPISPAGSDSWCQRGRAAEQRIERAADRLTMAEESYDRCNDAPRSECSRSGVESAEREVENAQDAQNELEADCRRSNCDPGWLRCAP